MKHLQVGKVPSGEASEAASKGLSRLTHGVDMCQVRAFGPAPKPTTGQCVPHSGFLADRGPNPAKNQASENTAAGTLIWPPQLAQDTAQLRLPPHPEGSLPALIFCSLALEPALG